MKKGYKNKEKSYYTCYIKAEDCVIISTSMSFIANRLGIHQATIRRHFENSDKYSTPLFTIEKNVSINTISRGFNGR